MLKEPAVQTAASQGLSLRGGMFAQRPLTEGVLLHAPCVKSSNRMATLVKFAIAVAVLVSVVVAGAVLQDAASATDFTQKNLAPSLAHPFGTDWMGRDMLVRTVAGLSTSVLVGASGCGVSSVIAGARERRLPWEESASMPR